MSLDSQLHERGITSEQIVKLGARVKGLSGKHVGVESFYEFMTLREIDYHIRRGVVDNSSSVNLVARETSSVGDPRKR